jgi:hypothetical protein
MVALTAIGTTYWVLRDQLHLRGDCIWERTAWRCSFPSIHSFRIGDECSRAFILVCVDNPG